MKIEKTTILIFVAITFIPGLFTKANTNLISNGSFEVGPNPGAVLPIVPGSTDINDWTVTRGGVDYIGTYWVAPPGSNRSLDLDNTPVGNLNGFGGIEQTFATTAGVKYLVTFAMAGNPYRGFEDPVIKHMRVEAAGDSNDFSFDTAPYSLNNMGWVNHSWQFTANDTSTTIEFYSLHYSYPGYSGYCGPALDNVSVSIVPEPATIALLGFGALSLLRRKRSV